MLGGEFMIFSGEPWGGASNFDDKEDERFSFSAGQECFKKVWIVGIYLDA
jgi:hypothetical protein